MKKYLAICSMFALVSASQAAVVFQEDFSGYTGPYPQALSTNAQVGTWDISTNGLIDVRSYTLLDGSTGPALFYHDDSSSVNPFLIAETVSYSASAIRITYDFKMRRSQIENQQFVAYARQSDDDDVAYSRMYKANDTTDWISMYGAGTGNNYSTRNGKEAWYTMVMELPAMPASGTFLMTYAVYDASGAGVYTNTLQLSYSEDAGSELINQLVFTALADASQTSMLIDNILIETIPDLPEPMVLFKADFSGYSVGGSPVALSPLAQVGTWDISTNGVIDVRKFPLRDGTTNACLHFVDDSGTDHPFVIAEPIAYTASPIKISYDFKMRRDSIDDQVVATYVRQSDGDDVIFIKMQDANGESDWVDFIAADGTNSNNRVSKNSWYRMEMELPVMPASGTFNYEWTIYDATGSVVEVIQGVGTKSDQLSTSTNAGPELIDRVVFIAPTEGNKTSVLYDNILIEKSIGAIGDIAVEYLGASDDLALTWSTGTGFDYTLLEKTDLINSTWSTNQTVPGGAGSVTVTTAVDSAQAFFKVISE